MSKFLSQISRDHTTTRKFSYTKGKCSLSFTLRTDIKSELKDFLELLKVAVEEIEKELNKNN